LGKPTFASPTPESRVALFLQIIRSGVIVFGNVGARYTVSDMGKAHTCYFSVLIVIAAMTFLASKPAKASEISIAGNFAEGSPTNNSPLNDGSFVLTFDVTGLPVRSGSELFLYQWELVFRAAAGAVAADLNGLQRDSFGVIQSVNANVPGDELKVGNSSSKTYLFLLLPAGFTGTGEVVPSNTYSFAIANGSDSIAVRAAATTPEPSVFGCCFAGLIVLGFSALKSVTASRMEGAKRVGISH
jgi:hypothetical protein